ncbi:MAG: ABC transporter permease [Clostridia bacterium]
MIKEYFIIAFRSLFSHKVRSLLTMLGVIIGVSSVILLISLGSSTRREAGDQIRGLGSNLILVTVTDNHGYLPRVWLNEIQENAKIKAFSPIISGSAGYSINGRDLSYTVNGVNEHYSFIASLGLDRGRFFSGVDVQNSNAVAVVGRKVVSEMFPYTDPLGEIIVVKGIPFLIIGILEEQGMTFAGDMDKVIYIPQSYASVFYPQQRRATYYVASESEEFIDITKNQMESYLSRMLPSSRLYSLTSQTQMLDILNQVMGLLTSLLAGIAAISLLVGGIGIMNIMLVTVRERTKEIGIRKALGANRSHILFQFLTEAVIVTLIGGIIGLLVSALGAALISSLAGFRISVGLDSVLLAISFSIAIGLFFGIYPANKAGKMEPVEALRFE